MLLHWLVRSLLQPERPRPRPPQARQQLVQVPQLQPLPLQLPVALLLEEAHLLVFLVQHQLLPTPDASQKTSAVAKVKRATNQTKA